MKVLIIEDNLILSRNITKMLIEDDIFAEISLNGDEGLQKALKNYYDIIVLDIDLPGKNGYEICKILRESQIEVGIIMLTSISGVENVVEGLNLGADDFISKPFEYAELYARIHSVYRRRLKNSSNTLIKIQNLEIDLQNMEVSLDSNKVKLSKIEFEILKYLASNKGKVISKNELFEKIWGESNSELLHSRTLDVHIKNLRKKIGNDFIQTKKGYGFIIL